MLDSTTVKEKAGGRWACPSAPRTSSAARSGAARKKTRFIAGILVSSKSQVTRRKAVASHNSQGRRKSEGAREAQVTSRKGVTSQTSQAVASHTSQGSHKSDVAGSRKSHVARH